jgi:hypothetical protein
MCHCLRSMRSLVLSRSMRRSQAKTRSLAIHFDFHIDWNALSWGSVAKIKL